MGLIVCARPLERAVSDIRAAFAGGFKLPRQGAQTPGKQVQFASKGILIVLHYN
jgi:hypothetical protein